MSHQISKSVSAKFEPHQQTVKRGSNLAQTGGPRSFECAEFVTLRTKSYGMLANLTGKVSLGHKHDIVPFKTSLIFSGSQGYILHLQDTNSPSKTTTHHQIGSSVSTLEVEEKKI